MAVLAPRCPEGGARPCRCRSPAGAPQPAATPAPTRAFGTCLSNLAQAKHGNSVSDSRVSHPPQTACQSYLLHTGTKCTPAPLWPPQSALPTQTPRGPTSAVPAKTPKCQSPVGPAHSCRPCVLPLESPAGQAALLLSKLVDLPWPHALPRAPGLLPDYRS